MAFDHIAVLGAGAWGSALANILARGGRSVTLWARNPALAAAISTSGENARLPGIPIEQRVAVTDRLADAAGGGARPPARGADGARGDPVRPELCGRCRARPADRGDACGCR